MAEAQVADAPAPATTNDNAEGPRDRNEVVKEEARAEIITEVSAPAEWQALNQRSTVVGDPAAVADNGDLVASVSDPLKPKTDGTPPKFMSTADAAKTVPVGDGKVTDNPLVREHTGPLDYAAERDRLLTNTSPEQRAATEANIAKLEDPNRQPPLTQQELARLYKATSDLIENKGGAQPPLMNDQQRQLMAAGILDNTANNTAIDQGYNNTCNVTTLEENMATEDAAAYAELMSDVARNSVPAGQQHGRDVVAWTSPDGQKVYMDRNSLMPDREAQARNGDRGQRDGDRNYASQVFDMMTINQYWQSQDPGALYTKDATSTPGDTGERLINSKGRIVSDSPYMGADAMSAVGNKLGLGENGQPFMVTNSIADGKYNLDGVAQVASTADMQKVLDNAQANGGFPLVVMVHTGHESMRDSQNQGGSGGWHVVTITGPGEKPGTWNMSNQWGQKFETSVTTDQLYQATLGPQHATSGYTGGGSIQGGGDGGGGQGGQGGQGGTGGGGDTDHGGRGMVKDEDFQKFKDDMGKEGKEADLAAQAHIDKIKAEIDALRGKEGSEGRIVALESEMQLLSSQLSR